MFAKLMRQVRRERGNVSRRGRPWSLPLEDRVLLVTAYRCTNLTLRQLAPAVWDLEVSGRSHHRPHRSAVGAAIQEAVPQGYGSHRRRHVGAHPRPQDPRAVEKLSLLPQPPGGHRRRRRLVVVVGQLLPGNRNDCRAWSESGAKTAVGTTTTIADGGYRGTGLVIPHRRHAKDEKLPAWQQAHNKSHTQVRARVEHVFARMKTWKILRDCRLKGDGVHHAMLGIAHLHNLALTE